MSPLPGMETHEVSKNLAEVLSKCPRLGLHDRLTRPASPPPSRSVPSRKISPIALGVPLENDATPDIAHPLVTVPTIFFDF